MALDYKIIEYNDSYNARLLALEKASPQGKLAQLEMLRKSFLSRSVVFSQYKIYLAVSPTDELMGVFAAALVNVEHQGQVFKAFSVYDAKVAPAFRGNGLTKALAHFALEDYSIPFGIEHHFLTMKSGNDAVFKSMFSVDDGQVSTYPFSYMTIPTDKRLDFSKYFPQDELFEVGIEEADFKRLESDYYYIDESDLAYFNTHKMYLLKITKLIKPLKVLQKILTFFYSNQQLIPEEGKILRFAALFNYNKENIVHLNRILEKLESENVNYLNVCCRTNGNLYKFLKPYCFNVYKYDFLSNFDTKPTDKLKIDVRCL